jgi:hypothetical protein
MRKLDRFFLEALKKEFVFLRSWDPDLNSAERPVSFGVKKELPMDTVWSLTYGRHNNEPDSSFTDGITSVGISNGQQLQVISLKEGEIRPSDILCEDTIYVLVKKEFRSQLVYNDAGWVNYILYKRAPVREIQEESAHAAQRMAAELK